MLLANTGLHHVPAESEIFEPPPAPEMMYAVSVRAGGGFSSFFHKVNEIRAFPKSSRAPDILFIGYLPKWTII
jgi:hypothetical protein